MGPQPHDPPPLPAHADVVVVGGGVVGLCCAHELRERGLDVVVLDGGVVGGGSSWANAGFVAPSHSIPMPAPGVVASALRWLRDPASPFYVRPRPSVALAAWLARFAWASRRAAMEAGIPVLRDLLALSAELYAELARRDDLAFGYVTGGILNVHATADGMARGAADARLLAAHGVTSRVVDGAELVELEPALRPGLAGGVLWEQDGWLDPARLVTDLAASLARRGVAVHERTEVLRLDAPAPAVPHAPDAGPAPPTAPPAAPTRTTTTRHVVTTRGTVAARRVVLAAGAWSVALARQLGVRLPLEPAKGYSITTAVAEPVVRRGLLLVDAKVAVTPLPGRLRLAGTLELAGLDCSISLRRVEAIRAAGRAHLPATAAGSPAREEIWRGLRPLSADGLPTIGAPAASPDVVIATGHGHIGVSLAPATGRLVADLVTGARPPLDVARLAPDRF